MRGRKRFTIFLILAAVLVLFSIAAPSLAPNDPYQTNVAMAKTGPSEQFPLGTDALGRCILSRVLAGAGTTVLSSLLLVAAMFVFGSLIGMISGWMGGLVDAVLMRFTDFLMAFPQMIVAIVVAGILGGGMANAMIALGVTGWTGYARVARSRVIAIKGEEYITAARMAGNTTGQILRRYLIPDTVGVLFVNAAIHVGSTMLNLAGLSFLGLGAKVPTPEWGSMVNEGRSLIQLAPQVVLAPAAAIFLTVVIFNLLGDAARDLLDTESRNELPQRKIIWKRAGQRTGNPAAGSKAGGAVKGQAPAAVDREVTKDSTLALLHTALGYRDKVIVKDISFSVHPGEVLGIAGESGAGKSTILRAVMQDGAEVLSGDLLLEGVSVGSLSKAEWRAARGARVGMVFQEPGAAFNPIRTYERQIRETLRAHGRRNWKKDKEELLALFRMMDLPDGEKLLKGCPCAMSGGMNQRIAIAAAALMHPKLLLLDEPTSALDVTVQRQVLNELIRLKERSRESSGGMAMLLITHNIGVIREMADRMIVLKDGEVMEEGTVRDVLANPQAEYTKELLRAVPGKGNVWTSVWK